MALQASGPISLSDIQTEFGGTNPISLSEYYAGGVYVPSGTGSIPSSGTISLSDFYGTSAALVVTVTEAAFDGGGFECKGFSLQNTYRVSDSSSPSTHSAFGSRTPTTVNGVTIRALYERYDKSVYQFEVCLGGTRPKDFFTSINVQGYGQLNTSSAGHDQVGGFTYWYWTTGNIARWDGTGTSTVTFA